MTISLTNQLPSFEMRAIMNHVVGHYVVNLDDCTQEHRLEIDRLIQKRLTGMPLAKIVGYKEFWKDRFMTSQHTLDPRPDSETLIEAVKDILPCKSILDLGTGTGCLLISLLKECPDATGVGVDICPNALSVAIQNANHLKVHDRSQFLQSNWCAGLDNQAFDIIISNPPYIESHEPINEGAMFDPPLALYGGLETYEQILQSIDSHLANRPKFLCFEVGFQQAQKVADLLKQYRYTLHTIRKDLSGIERVVVACA